MYTSYQAYYLSFYIEFSFQANLCPDPCFKAGAADSLDSTSKNMNMVLAKVSLGWC